MKLTMLTMTAFVAAAVFAEPGTNEGFLRNQAMVEVQRIANQIDVLQSNYDELSERFGKTPRYDREIAALRSDIDALRGAVESLRRDMANQRSEIVAELTKKIVEIQKRQGVPPPQPPAAQPKRPAPEGPCREYVVEKGDTLSLISQAFNTSVKKIKEMNNLKGDGLRVGQKLLVPEVK